MDLTRARHGGHRINEGPAPEDGAPGPTGGSRRRRRVEGLVLAAGGLAVLGAGLLTSGAAMAGAASGAVAGGVRLTDVSQETLPAAMAGLLPGGYVYRYLDVINEGSQASTFAGQVTVTGELAGQLSVEAVTCSVPWTTASGVSTCTGSTGPVLGAGTPTSVALVGLDHGVIGPGATGAQHVRYLLALKATAAPGLTGDLNVTVSSTVIGAAVPSIG